MEKQEMSRAEEMQALAADILTVEETAQILKVGRVAVCRALQRGTLPGVKVGGQWRISKKRLEAYIAGKNPQEIEA